MKKDFVNNTIKELIEWVSDNIPMKTDEGIIRCKYCGKDQSSKKKHEKYCLHIRAKKLRKMLISEES